MSYRKKLSYCQQKSIASSLEESFLQATKTTNTQELKKDKFIDYVLGWKSKWIYTFKLTPLYTIFLNSAKRFGYRTGKKFNDSVLVLKQINYKSKIVKVYIVYDLDTCSEIPLNNFTLKNCLFGTTD